jgi:hypothetical protein
VTLSEESASGIASFDIGSFDLVCQFVEHVVAKNAAGLLGNGRSLRSAIDWEALEASVVDSNSVEHAIGRAVVIADQMCRGVFDDTHLDGSASSPNVEDPFFAFSVANVTPDFGDESRYRRRVARKVTRLFRTRRTVVALSVSVVLALLSVTLYQITQQGPSGSTSYRIQSDRGVLGSAQLLKTSLSPAVSASLSVPTAPPAAAPPSLSNQYTGDWNNQTVALTLWTKEAHPSVAGTS